LLLIAEVAASAAVVSEAALVYIARHRNVMVSLTTIGLQSALSFALITLLRSQGYNEKFQGAGVAFALAVSLGVGSLLKMRLAARLLNAPVSVWRWPLIGAALAAGLIGAIALQGPEWSQLTLGVVAILGSYCWIIWKYGFGDEDRALFRTTNGGDAASSDTKAQ
jgi:hypothetical protein